MNFIDNSARFDLQSALDRFSGDHELLEEAISIFKEEAVKHLEAIQENMNKDELKIISEKAHTLKGECGAVGAVKAQSISLAVEKRATEKNFAEVQELFPLLEKEILSAIKLLPEAGKKLNR